MSVTVGITAPDGNNVSTNAADNFSVISGINNNIFIADGSLAVPYVGITVTDAEFDADVSALVNEVNLGNSTDTHSLSGIANNVTLFGGGGSDYLTGAATATLDLYGGKGDDTLDARSSSVASMKGGLGNDTYYVDGIGDQVIENAGEGIDTVHSTLDAYVLTDNVDNLVLDGVGNIHGHGNALDNIITGNGGDNVVSGEAGNDTLYGNGGNDILNGGVGSDAMYGGTGNDLYIVDDVNDKVFELAGEGTDTVQTTLTSYALSDNVERLTFTGAADSVGYGNSSDNILIGGNGSDTLYGLDGNDIIDAGAGSDTLYGGNGNDALNGRAGNDFISGGKGNDNLSGGTGADTFSFSSGDAKDYINDFSSAEDVLMLNFGSASASYQTAMSHASQVGNNTVFDFGGGDTITLANVQKSTLSESNFNIVQEGTSSTQSATVLASNVENLALDGKDNINGHGNALDNIISGNAGNNVVSGEAGNDTLYGYGGNDTLNGGSGADNMYGGVGNDFYIVDNVNDKVIELANEGTDTVQTTLASYTLGDNVERLTFAGMADAVGYGNSADNFLSGNSGSNKLYGYDGADVIDAGSGSDYLYGGSGSDMLNGRDGNDWIAGGIGNDNLTGGSGRDTFVFSTGDGKDYVNDFSAVDDYLDLGFGSASSTYDAAIAHANQVGNNTVFTFGADSITLANVQKSALTSSNFGTGGLVG